MAWLPGKLRVWDTTNKYPQRRKTRCGIDAYGSCGVSQLERNQYGPKDSHEDAMAGVKYMERYSGSSLNPFIGGR
jgi:hypothetical protein